MESEQANESIYNSPTLRWQIQPIQASFSKKNKAKFNQLQEEMPNNQYIEFQTQMPQQKQAFSNSQHVSHSSLNPLSHKEQHEYPNILIELNASELSAKNSLINQSTTNKNISQEKSQTEELLSQISEYQIQVDTQINKYFKKLGLVKSSSMENFGRLHPQRKAYLRVKRDIKNGIIVIPKQSKPFKVKALSSSKHEQNTTENIRMLLQSQKREVMNKLKQIQLSQLSLKQRSCNSFPMKIRLRKNSTNESRSPSEVEEERLKVKKALKACKELEQQSILKQKHLAIDYQQYYIGIRKQREEELNDMRKGKQAKAINRIKKNQERAKDREIIRKIWKQREAQLKKQKYLYKEMSKEERKMQHETEKRKIIQLARLRDEKKLVFQDIKQHDRKYQEQLQNRAVSRTQSVISHPDKKYQRTYFSRLVREENELVQRKQIDKLSKTKEHEYQCKLQQYKEYVLRNYKPNLKNSHKFIPVPRCNSLQALTFEKQREKGIEYLQLAKKLKAPQGHQREARANSQTRIHPKHHDYLRQIENRKFERENQGFRDDKAERKFSEMIGKKKCIINYQEANQAKFLVDHIEARAKKSADAKAYETALHKLQLLSIMQ